MLTHADASLPGPAGENFITPSLSAYGCMRSKPSALLSLIPKTDAATRLPSRKHLILDLLGTAEQTCPAGGNETSLLTGNGVARDGRGLSDMLVVTTTVGMVDGVHGNTRVRGQLLRLAANLCLARDAFRRGLSVRPPPATIPTIPRQVLGRTFLAPEGSLTRVLPSSGLWPMTVT